MRDVALLVFPGFQALDLAVGTVFEVANHEAGASVYRVRIVAEAAGAVATSLGAGVEAERMGGDLDTLLVCGALGIPTSTSGLLRTLERGAKSARRTGAICTGAFLLAETGLLDHRHATTHWMHAADLQRGYPKCKVVADRIFVRDDHIWTSAGMTACIDLALSLVEEDCGKPLAKRVAQTLVVYHRRLGGQSQYSPLLELDAQSDRIQAALAHARANLEKDLSVERLAEVAHLSPRQFARVFRSETGSSPAKAVERLRLEAAHDLLSQSVFTSDVIAARTGFGDATRMRRAFVRVYGQTPQSIRRHERRRDDPIVLDEAEQDLG